MPPVLNATRIHRTIRRNTAFPIVLAAALFLLSACGSADVDGPAIDGPATTDDGPRVADQRFDGEFVAISVTVDGQPVTLLTDPLVIIETEFGSLTINPGCNSYFGSFTLAEDGTASFTVAGGSTQDCGELTRQEDAVLAAIAGVESWTATDRGFRFDGRDGDAITVVGP